jgi:hypothetical protein
MDQRWAAQVGCALLAGDRPALRRLFEQAVAVEGREAASASWLAAVSAFDADAVTG